MNHSFLPTPVSTVFLKPTGSILFQSCNIWDKIIGHCSISDKPNRVKNHCNVEDKILLTFSISVRHIIWVKNKSYPVHQRFLTKRSRVKRPRAFSPEDSAEKTTKEEVADSLFRLFTEGAGQSFLWHVGDESKNFCSKWENIYNYLPKQKFKSLLDFQSPEFLPFISSQGASSSQTSTSGLRKGWFYRKLTYRVWCPNDSICLIHCS